MCSIKIPPGKIVQVITKGSKTRKDVAPSLEFRGRLHNVTDQFIELTYAGEKAIMSNRGRVTGYERGEKVQRIYSTTIESVVAVGR
jgi:hypothetical protein